MHGYPQPLPAHSKRGAHESYPNGPPFHFVGHDPRMLAPMASLPVPTMQLMMTQHDAIMKQYNMAMAERLARIVEERSAGNRQF